MSENGPPSIASVPSGQTAGAPLRAAREKQGIHIAVLAAAIKISPRKLDALEGDRYSELPDATFTRALAQTVCRALKIDAAPVMALLPQPGPSTLDAVGEGLNTPFRERFSGPDLGAMVPRAPLLWMALALVLAATAVYYWPASPPVPSTAGTEVPTATVPPAPPSRPPGTVDPVPGTATSAVTLPAAAPTAETFASGAAATVPASAAPSTPTESTESRGVPPITVPPITVPPPSTTGASLVASEPVWLEVIDGNGVVVFQRTIQPGENLSFDHTPPLKLKIGNAGAAKLSFRGEPVDLTAFTRGNVARVVLK